MSKKFFFKIAVGLVFLAAAVIWLLSVLMPEKFGNLNLSWLIAAVCAALGVLFVISGLFSKTVGIAKKFYIIVGAALIIAAVLALVGTFIDTKLALPIIAVIIAVGALLCVIAVGGKKWDEGDNKKVGYKNYYQRKEEEEKERRKNEENN